MRRRDKAGGKAAKTQRPKTLKRRNAPKAPHRHSSITAGKETNVAQLTRDLIEAREQQTATSEVLKVISSSPTELQSVLDMVGENAARLCDANNAVIFRLDGDVLRHVASYGGIPTTSHPSGGLPVKPGYCNRACRLSSAAQFTSTISPRKSSEYPVGSRMRNATAIGPRWQLHCYAKVRPLEQF